MLLTYAEWSQNLIPNVICKCASRLICWYINDISSLESGPITEPISIIKCEIDPQESVQNLFNSVPGRGGIFTSLFDFFFIKSEPHRFFLRTF